MWLICATDYQDHAVTDGAMEAGVTAGTGTYQAICGHTVYTCSMTEPPGPPCRDCENRHAQQVADEERRNRWWRRVARRSRGWKFGPRHREGV